MKMLQFSTKVFRKFLSADRTDKYRAVAIKRNDKTIIPRGNEQFQLGDTGFCYLNP